MTRVLFVCLGNICRSPAAEAVVRAKAASAGVSLDLDSCGTGDWHIGKPPYPPMIAAAGARGYDLRPLRARRLVPGDLDRFDHIVAMDRANLDDIRAMGDGRARVSLMMEHAPDKGLDEVPDPYFTGDYDEALDLIERAADGLIAVLR
ncbi:low molecular weight protein-tyrosine-phosphatase [Oceanibium sediminis]|uniref:low molecular weight protein-tyrosine-phosphatase n=1 Tax=Oceanibium sediminis TaxID=2026339 RepID=UPI000DD31200|nr:low molecular weight protein-tyrosine-phosphatase [Oceanibium sediminis]